MEEQKFYGQIRVMSVGGEQLEWTPQLINDDAEQTRKIKSTLQTYVSNKQLVVFSSLFGLLKQKLQHNKLKKFKGF